MYKVVIDTNVFISGTIQKKGFPYNVIKSWENGVFIFITSYPLIEEIEKVLNYPKIKNKYLITENDITQIISNLLKYSVIIDSLTTLNVIQEDPEDNKILSTAIGGDAEYIISGDSHLLDLKNYKGIEILTPKEFCEKLQFIS